MPNNKIISNKNTAIRKPKDKVISARISGIEYMALKKRAKDAGVTLSKFVRSVLLMFSKISNVNLYNTKRS